MDCDISALVFGELGRKRWRNVADICICRTRNDVSEERHCSSLRRALELPRVPRVVIAESSLPEVGHRVALVHVSDVVHQLPNLSIELFLIIKGQMSDEILFG
jgi:hypothetical protein